MSTARAHRGRPSSGVPLFGLALALACEGSAEVVDPADDAIPDGVPGEVRGLRLIAEEDAVTARALEAPRAETYVYCAHDEPAPLEGECREGGPPPYRFGGLEPGEALWWAVFAKNDAGRGPVVEVARAGAGAAERPRQVRMRMDPDDLDHLYERSIWSDRRLPVEIDLASGEGARAAIPEIRGIRFRGHSTRHDPRKSYHIRLDERPRVRGFPDFNFRGQGRRGGDRVLLNQTWTDPTGVRPALSFAMYEAIGLPAPATFFVDVWINGAYEGHYIGVERIDREALARWFLNREHGEFTLVRDRSRQRAAVSGHSVFAVSPDALGEDEASRLSTLGRAFDNRGEAGDQDWGALLELIEWTYDTPAGPAWEEGLRERFDVDALVDVLAVKSMQYDFDSFADDYWLYRDGAGDGVWRVIPWDKNLTFGQRFYPHHTTSNDFFYFHGEITDHFSHRLFERTVDTLRERIDARAAELYEAVFTPAWFDETVAELAAEARDGHLRPPEPAFRLHPRQHDTAPTWFDWHVEALREFVALRRAFLTAERDGGEAGVFDGPVALDERGEAYLTDGDGWVLARLRGTPGALLNLRVELLPNPGASGVERRWTIENRGGPVDVEIALPYKNRPGTTWLPELEVAGRSWELGVVDRGRYRYPTRVNPFANLVATEITLGAAHDLEVLYRR